MIFFCWGVKTETFIEIKWRNTKGHTKNWPPKKANTSYTKKVWLQKSLETTIQTTQNEASSLTLGQHLPQRCLKETQWFDTKKLLLKAKVRTKVWPIRRVNKENINSRCVHIYIYIPSLALMACFMDWTTSSNKGIPIL